MKIHHKFLNVIFALLMTMTSVCHAEKVVVPPADVEQFAKKLAFRDFPKAIDIITIIRVESNFKKTAFNKERSKKNLARKLPPSRGLMQVQGGSYDMYVNMMQGTAILRANYIRFGNVRDAVISYNIGPTAHAKGRAQVSGKEYWEKYLLRKKQYLKHYGKEF